jgi:hypothetical protein
MYMKKLLISLIIILFVDCTRSMEVEDGVHRQALEQVFTDSTYQLTGVAVSHEGRMFTNYPLWSDI